MTCIEMNDYFRKRIELETDDVDEWTHNQLWANLRVGRAAYEHRIPVDVTLPDGVFKRALYDYLALYEDGYDPDWEDIVWDYVQFDPTFYTPEGDEIVIESEGWLCGEVEERNSK